MRFIIATRDERLHIPAVGHPREAAIGADDVVLLCVKGQQTEEALRDLYDAAGDDVPVVCAQNGVANERIALRRFRRVYGMVVFLPGEHLEPGEIVNTAEDPAGILDVGCYPSGVDAVAIAVAGAITDAGCSALPDPDVMRQKYAKLLANLGNALQAACDGGAREIMRTLRAEALACYEAAGIDCATAEETRARRASGIRPAREDLPVGSFSEEDLAAIRLLHFVGREFGLRGVAMAAGEGCENGPLGFQGRHEYGR